MFCVERIMRLICGVVFLFAFIQTAFSISGDAAEGEQVRSEILYKDGTVKIASDTQLRDTKTQYRAVGHVAITYQDWVMTGDEAVFDQETRQGYVTGHVRFTQKLQWLSCSRAEFNFNNRTGIFYDATGYTDRQFWISSRTIRKTGPDTYAADTIDVTSCKPENPKWTFSASRTSIHVDKTARLRNVRFKIKGIPVFYFPYLVFPMEKKERSSGFVPFQTGNSTSKGRVLSEGWYQTLGESADALIYADYFSLRGLAIGGDFRIRPNPSTWFDLQAYGIRDKLGKGGVRLVVDGETQLKNDWRAVAKVNITSNFEFRQVFSDSFRAATVSQEKAVAFLTRNHQSFSTNIAFGRDEILFPNHTLIIKKLPSIEFISLGTPLGRSPFILNFRTSLDGASRVDSLMDLQHLMQRMDFHPSLTLRLPSLLGFSLVPTIGVRETYYGAQLSEESPSGITNNGLHRRYFDLSLDFKTPVLERDFSSKWFGEMQHVVEPFATYRLIDGIKNFDKIIRFDEEDAIADTSEVEYGITNRFFRSRKNRTGTDEKHEFMSFSLIQKYYFDPTFGGAFKSGTLNSFHPLDSVTGFYQTGLLNNVAPVSAILQLSPRDGIHNDIRADFDPNRRRLRNSSISTIWNQGKFGISGTYFRTFTVEKGMMDGNNVQGEIRYGSPDRGFYSSVTLSYNLRNSQLLNSHTRANYTWDCCGISMEFKQYDLGLRTESRFSFSFSLKGLGSFGNMKRQDGIF
jgi:LPS-assembly protein